MRALVTINGYDLPEPSEYEATTSDFVDSSRNVQGYVIGSVVRSGVSKVSLKWKFLTVEDWSHILKCFEPKYGGSFYNKVTFFNQTSGAWETKEFYVSDRKASMFRRDPYSGGVLGYLNPSLSLVEV